MGAGPARALSVSTRIVDLLTPRRHPLGRIHSVYARTLNVLYADGRLVCLHPGPVMLSPFSLRIGAWPAGFPGVLTPGSAVGVVGRRLVSGPLTIALEDALPWSPTVPKFCAPAASPPPHLPTGLLRHELSRGPENGLAGTLTDPSASHLKRIALRAGRDLGRAVRIGDRDAFLSAAGRLLGLGPGLTPSGDDFLVGFLGLIVAAGGPAGAWVAGLRRPLLHAAEELTTDLSQAFLDAAFDAAFAEPVGDLLGALVRNAPGEVVTARAEALLGLGHSSGADTLAGVICAADVLSPVGAESRGPVGVR